MPPPKKDVGPEDGPRKVSLHHSIHSTSSSNRVITSIEEAQSHAIEYYHEPPHHQRDEPGLHATCSLHHERTAGKRTVIPTTPTALQSTEGIPTMAWRHCWLPRASRKDVLTPKRDPNRVLDSGELRVPPFSRKHRKHRKHHLVQKTSEARRDA